MCACVSVCLRTLPQLRRREIKSIRCLYNPLKSFAFCLCVRLIVQFSILSFSAVFPYIHLHLHPLPPTPRAHDQFFLLFLHCWFPFCLLFLHLCLPLCVSEGSVFYEVGGWLLCGWLKLVGENKSKLLFLWLLLLPVTFRKPNVSISITGLTLNLSLVLFFFLSFFLSPFSFCDIRHNTFVEACPRNTSALLSFYLKLELLLIFPRSIILTKVFRVKSERLLCVARWASASTAFAAFSSLIVVPLVVCCVFCGIQKAHCWEFIPPSVRGSTQILPFL